MNTITHPHTLIQSLMDAQEEMVFLLADGSPVMMNKAALKFFSVKSLEEYKESFGAFSNNFVPHPSYFNMHKVPEGESWINVLAALSDKDRIISMLNASHEPRAFEAGVDLSHSDYAILTLKDVSANLIKCIMIENDVSMDKASGAYNKEYFLHTSELLHDGAIYNEKEIGLTMMRLELDDPEHLTQLVSAIKQGIRQTDMLVKWSSSSLVLAYMVDKAGNAMVLSEKLHDIITSERRSGMNFNIAVTLVKEREKITAAIKRLSAVLDEDGVNKLKLI